MHIRMAHTATRYLRMRSWTLCSDASGDAAMRGAPLGKECILLQGSHADDKTLQCLGEQQRERMKLGIKIRFEHSAIFSNFLIKMMPL